MPDLHENEYLTLKSSGESLFKDKGSKFFGYAFYFDHAEGLKEKLEEIKKNHHQARHHCFAYRINPRHVEERANDDGEPAHTAGTPILGQLQSQQLVNAMVVVVRYFGGTKLGVSGLINAYKLAAKEALENAVIEKCELESVLNFTFEYPEMNEVMRIIKKLEPRIIKQDMHLRVEMQLSTRDDRLTVLADSLKKIKSVNFTK